MPPYLALSLGILSRLVPSLLHHPGYNLTAVGASLLFFGARRSPRELPVAALVFAATDFLLTTVAFRYPFHTADYLATWLWYLVIPLVGHALLRPASPTTPSPSAVFRSGPTQPFVTHPPHAPSPSYGPVRRASLAVLLAAGSFFLLSNGAVWLLSSMYPRTTAGLLACFAAGLPFLRNDLLSTGLTLALFLALPAPATLHARLRRRLNPGSPAPTSR